MEIVSSWVLLGGKILVQYGGIRSAVAAKATVVDLNPRSATAWLILVARRLCGRRTLVWGHLYPRKGVSANTAGVRHEMRRLASGMICYSYADHADAVAALPKQPAWVAPNAIFHEEAIRHEVCAERDCIVYVGRLVREKRVELLVRATAILAAEGFEVPTVLIGEGEERGELEALVRRLGVEHLVEFKGWVDDASRLAKFYQTARLSVSPGYAGLSLTQSLGFGVPVIVADEEDHAPEIELKSTGGVVFFRAGDQRSLAKQIRKSWDWIGVERDALADDVRNRYSAESMSRGIMSALLGRDPIR